MAEVPTKLVYLGRANVQGSPIYIADVGSGKLAVLTNKYTLSLLDKENYRIGASAVLLKESKFLHNYSKFLSVSSKRDVAVVGDGSKEVSIFSFASGSFVKRMDITSHNEPIEVTAFSKDGLKFASGDIEGMVQVFDTRKFNVILTPDKLGDYVSYITFSENSRLVAIASYGRTITIYDIDRMQKSHHSAVHGLIERMQFFDDDKLFFITREQGCGIYDLTQKKVSSYKTTFTSWPTSIAITSDKKYAFVGTKTQYLYVVRLSDNERVITLKLTNTDGIASLCIDSGKLFVCHTNGDIEVIDVEQGVKELGIYLKSKEWEKAAELCRKNSLLNLYPEMLRMFELGWKEALPKAIAAISRGNIDVAKGICKPFLDDEKRASEFNFYVAQSRKVAEFVDLVEKKDFTKAYNLTVSAPFLKKTPTYSVLEKHWEKAFEAAKKMLDDNPIGNRLPVQHMLKPFAANPVTKPRISGLMSNYAKYIEADNFLKNRDFASYFEMCTKHAFLKDTHTFKKAVAFGEQLVEKEHVLESEEKFREALQIAKTLTGFPAHSAFAIERVTYLSDLVSFIDLVDDAIFGEASAIISCYEIASSQPKFQSLREFQLLIKRFHDVADNAMVKAINSTPIEVIQALNPYTEIQYWSSKVKEIMKVAYLSEMKKTANSNEFVDWTRAFENYASMFGKDSEVEAFAVQAKQMEAFKMTSSVGRSSGYGGYLPTIFY